MISKRVSDARRYLFVLAAFILAFGFQDAASGAMFQFTLTGPGLPNSPTSNQQINYNNAVNAAGQLWLHIADDPDNIGTRVNLTFYYLGPVQGEITDIYFDDAGLGEEPQDVYVPTSILTYVPGPAISVTSSSGVDFAASEFATPGVPINALTSLGQVAFSPDLGFSAESSEVTGAGVNNGWLEWVTLNLNGTEASFVAALGQEFENVQGTRDTYQLRIVVQVQDIGTGGDQSTDRYYVVQSNASLNSPPVLPEPATMTMWGLGMAACGLVGFAKARSKKVVA